MFCETNVTPALNESMFSGEGETAVKELNNLYIRHKVKWL